MVQPATLEVSPQPWWCLECRCVPQPARSLGRMPRTARGPLRRGPNAYSAGDACILREQRAKSPATTRQQSGLANRRARSRGAARSSSNTRRRSGSGQRPPWQSPRSPFDDFIQSPPPVEARSRSQSASRARSREGRYADPTAATWLRQRPPSAKRERPQQHGSTALTPRGAGSGPRHGGSSLREKVGLSRRDDRQVPAPAVAASRHRGDGFERAKRVSLTCLMRIAIRKRNDLSLSHIATCVRIRFCRHLRSRGFVPCA